MLITVDRVGSILHDIFDSAYGLLSGLFLGLPISFLIKSDEIIINLVLVSQVGLPIVEFDRRRCESPRFFVLRHPLVD